MVHQRSPEAQLRRDMRKAAREYVMRYSFKDIIIAEEVSRSDPEEVTGFLEATFGYADLSAVPCVFKGVVISDSYGRGVFQR